VREGGGGACAKDGSELSKGRLGHPRLPQVREEFEGEGVAEVGSRSSHCGAEDGNGVKRRAAEHSDGVIYTRACEAASRAQGRAGGGDGLIIKVAEADANRAGLRAAISTQCSGKGGAQGVCEHRTSHQEDIIQKSHKPVAGAEGDAPGVSV